MASAQPKLAAELARIPLATPLIPVISNVTAAAHGEPADITRLLVEQVTGSVRWEESMRALIAQGFTRFIELGPGTALTGFLRRIDKSVTVLQVSDAASLAATVSALRT